MFENYKVFETEFAGRKITFETGKMCALASSSILVRYGETAVLCNVTASKTPREGIDYFPLSVDFDEKLYSVGKIPGSFPRREGRPTDRAILDSRVIDRPMRPLFPKDMRNDCAVVMSAMSVDPDYSYVICGAVGSSMAIAGSATIWLSLQMVSPMVTSGIPERTQMSPEWTSLTATLFIPLYIKH